MKAEKSWTKTHDRQGATVLRATVLRATALGAAILGIAWWTAVPARAGTDGTGITGIEVGCDDRGTRCRAVLAGIELPGGIGGQLLLSFEDATALGASTFEISAELVDPRDPQVTDRLPRDTFIPSDFPVLVRIEPNRDGLLSFRRNWTLELVTENLEFSSRTPFRLFRAPTGGTAFEDISTSLGSGSFRVRGAAASFSEFVIAADLRPVERVAGRKLAQLEARLSEHAEEIAAVADELDQLAGQARQAVEAGNLPAAVRALESIIGLVAASSGTEIPDDTSPGDGVVGIAARLLSSAMTLRHTLFLGLQSAQGGMSGFSRRVDAGVHSVEVNLDFEEAFVVDPEDLDISAELIDVNDPALLARLPEGVNVPEEFPVLLRINPKPEAEPAFSGIFEVELRTDSLDFLGGTPLRLFKAPDGGAFEDVTRTFGLGSFRVRGAAASFSEFLIGEDMRPIETVVAQKFEDLVALLEANAEDIPAALAQELENAIGQIRQDAEQGLFDAAFDGIATVAATVLEASSGSLTALWRSGAAVNVAGELRSLLETLVFSLELQQTPPVAQPGDVNLDGQVDVGDIFFLIDQIFGDSPPPAEVFFPSSTHEQE